MKEGENSMNPLELLKKYRNERGKEKGRKLLRCELKSFTEIEETGEKNRDSDNRYIMNRKSSKAAGNRGERGLGWDIYVEYKYGKSAIKVNDKMLYVYSFEVPMRGYWRKNNDGNWENRKKADFLLYNKSEHSLAVAELKGKRDNREKGSFILEGILELVIYYWDIKNNFDQIKKECAEGYSCKGRPELSRKAIENSCELKLSSICFLIAPKEYWKEAKKKGDLETFNDFRQKLKTISIDETKIKIIPLKIIKKDENHNYIKVLEE